jgi:hypothetical protein
MKKLMLLACIVGIMSADIVHAGLLTTDGADPVEAGKIEAELNGSYTIDKARSGGITAKCHSTDGDVTLTVGVVSGVDLSASLPYTFVSREKINGGVSSRVDGFNDATLDVKLRFYDRDGLRLAIKPGVFLPTGKNSEGLSDGKVGFAAVLLATREFADGKLLIHGNGGYERHNYKDVAVNKASRSDIFTFSVAGEAEVAAGLKLAVDIGLATNAEKESGTPPVYALFGGTYAVTENLEVYAGIKVGLSEPESDATGLAGLKFKF